MRAKLAENNEFIERLEKESANIAAFQAYTLSEKLKQAEQKVADCRAQFEEQRLALTFDGFLPDRTYLAEVNRGTGMKFSPKLKLYFQWSLPILILIILIQGLI